MSEIPSEKKLIIVFSKYSSGFYFADVNKNSSRTRRELRWPIRASRKQN